MIFGNFVQAANDGATPAYIAAQCGFHQCLNVLAALGADMKRADERGSTPMHQASVFIRSFVWPLWPMPELLVKAIE
jgi:ankyrin repeat protein